MADLKNLNLVTVGRGNFTFQKFYSSLDIHLLFIELADCILTGNYMLKLFNVKVAIEKLDAVFLVDTIGSSGDDAITLSTEDNIGVNSTLAISFWGAIFIMRDVS